MFQDFEAYIPCRQWLVCPKVYTTCNDTYNINIMQHPNVNTQAHITTSIQHVWVRAHGHHTTISNVSNTSHDHSLKIHEYHNTKVHLMAITQHTRAQPQPPSHPAADPRTKPASSRRTHLHINKIRGSVTTQVITGPNNYTNRPNWQMGIQ